jgi:hypothetical protein
MMIAPRTKVRILTMPIDWKPQCVKCGNVEGKNSMFRVQGSGFRVQGWSARFDAV